MKKELKKKYYLYQMDMMNNNLLSIVILGILVVLTYFISTKMLVEMFDIFEMNFALLMLSLLGYLILHELLHSLAYVIYGGKFDRIIYGIELEKGILYCLCKQNISKKNILHSLMYPFFFIGLITYIVSLIFNLPLLMALSIVNITGCCGDFAMFAFISKLPKDIEFSELDDSTSFAIYTEKDISNIKSFGINYIDSSDNIDRNDLEKVKVSKVSKYVLIVLAVLSVLSLFIGV